MAEEWKNTPGAEGEAPQRQDYSEELMELIRRCSSPAALRDALESYHDSDIADVLEQLDPPARKRLYRVLGTERMSDVFAYLEDVGQFIEELDAERAADVIEGMDADDAVDVLEELDDDKREALLGLMNADAAEDIQLIHSYDEDAVGSRMTTNYVAINRHLSVKDAMRSLVRQAADNDNISTLYALNDDGTFYGAIDLKDLIIAREGTELDDLIVTSYPFVYAEESVEDCIEELKDYSEDSIPVLDSDRRLLGVITAQDIVEVVDEEMGEDYARLAGLTEEEEADEPLLKSIRKRLPWLVVLMFLGLGVSAVVGVFESVVQSLTLIMCFQSLILGMAGNVGTQSLAVTIRTLADEDDDKPHRSLYLIGKEVRVGIINGLLLGIISFVLVGLYILLVKGQDPILSFMVSGCIGLALLVAMTVSSFTGTAIPILFDKIHIDPAAASGPLITTVNDLVAVVTYYGLSWVLLIEVFHLAG